jgi:hypothetical protein
VRHAAACAGVASAVRNRPLLASTSVLARSARALQKVNVVLVPALAPPEGWKATRGRPN